MNDNNGQSDSDESSYIVYVKTETSEVLPVDNERNYDNVRRVDTGDDDCQLIGVKPSPFPLHVPECLVPVTTSEKKRRVSSMRKREQEKRRRQETSITISLDGGDHAAAIDQRNKENGDNTGQNLLLDRNSHSICQGQPHSAPGVTTTAALESTEFSAVDNGNHAVAINQGNTKNGKDKRKNLPLDKSFSFVGQGQPHSAAAVTTTAVALESAEFTAVDGGDHAVAINEGSTENGCEKRKNLPLDRNPPSVGQGQPHSAAVTTSGVALEITHHASAPISQRETGNGDARSTPARGPKSTALRQEYPHSAAVGTIKSSPISSWYARKKNESAKGTYQTSIERFFVPPKCHLSNPVIGRSEDCSFCTGQTSIARFFAPQNRHLPNPTVGRSEDCSSRTASARTASDNMIFCSSSASDGTGDYEHIAGVQRGSNSASCNESTVDTIMRSTQSLKHKKQIPGSRTGKCHQLNAVARNTSALAMETDEKSAESVSRLQNDSVDEDDTHSVEINEECSEDSISTTYDTDTDYEDSPDNTRHDPRRPTARDIAARTYKQQQVWGNDSGVAIHLTARDRAARCHKKATAHKGSTRSAASERRTASGSAAPRDTQASKDAVTANEAAVRLSAANTRKARRRRTARDIAARRYKEQQVGGSDSGRRSGVPIHLTARDRAVRCDKKATAHKVSTRYNDSERLTATSRAAPRDTQASKDTVTGTEAAVRLSAAVVSEPRTYDFVLASDTVRNEQSGLTTDKGIIARKQITTDRLGLAAEACPESTCRIGETCLDGQQRLPPISLESFCVYYCLVLRNFHCFASSMNDEPNLNSSHRHL